MVSASANIHMTYQIEYFHPRVLAEIRSWPVDVLADYAHLAGLLAEQLEHGETRPLDIRISIPAAA